MTDPAAPPIEVRGLVKRYGALEAVAGVDLTVNAGDVYGYLGPNGAGKTTSLRMMLGLITPTAGTVRLFGRDPITSVSALEGVAGSSRRRRSTRTSVPGAISSCSRATTAVTRAAASTRPSTSSSSPVDSATGSAATRTGCASGWG